MIKKIAELKNNSVAIIKEMLEEEMHMQEDHGQMEGEVSAQ